MNYVIREFNQDLGSILVQYSKVGTTLTVTYAFEVPIVDNAYIVGDALHSFIMERAPTEFLDRAISIAANVTNASAIQALVVPHPQDPNPGAGV